MNGMSIQDRYDDVAAISGLSEDIIRRVYKATGQSVAKSLSRGERATVPGICTLVPEIRSRLNIGGTSTDYIKVKASASSSLASKVEKLESFDKSEKDVNKETEDIVSKKLWLKDPELGQSGIITTQITALL